MRVHLIKKQSIKGFIQKNAQSKAAFENWLYILAKVDWEKSKDIIATFNSADILGKSSERVVFNIAGNQYRMICSYYFGKKRIHLFVKWIGTHPEYDRLCQRGLQYTISKY